MFKSKKKTIHPSVDCTRQVHSRSRYEAGVGRHGTVYSLLYNSIIKDGTEHLILLYKVFSKDGTVHLILLYNVFSKDGTVHLILLYSVFSKNGTIHLILLYSVFSKNGTVNLILLLCDIFSKNGMENPIPAIQFITQGHNVTNRFAVRIQCTMQTGKYFWCFVV